MKTMIFFIILILIVITVVVLAVVSISSSEKTEVINTENPPITPQEENNMKNTLSLKSEAFNNNEMIPSKYTCEGGSLTPPLEISGIPEKTKSLAIIMEDPDATNGVYVHWVRWNIPATTTLIAEDMEPGGIHGKNTSGKTGYVGPCPPTGTHRYFFKLYALDIMLSLADGDKFDLEKAMSGHILEQTELIGLYQKIR